MKFIRLIKIQITTKSDPKRIEYCQNHILFKLILRKIRTTHNYLFQNHQFRNRNHRIRR